MSSEYPHWERMTGFGHSSRRTGFTFTPRPRVWTLGAAVLRKVPSPLAVLTVLVPLVMATSARSPVRSPRSKPPDGHCSLAEIRSNEPYMWWKGNATAIPVGGNVTVFCRNRPHLKDTLTCQTSKACPEGPPRLGKRLYMTCNFFCPSPEVRIWQEGYTPEYHRITSPQRMYPQGTKLNISELCRGHHAAPRNTANAMSECVLNKDQDLPMWSPRPTCYYEKIRECVLPGQTSKGAVDMRHTKLLAQRRRLFLGQTAQLSCANRPDRDVTVQCNLVSGLQVISAPPSLRASSVEELSCENPCNATLVIYDRPTAHRQYLVRVRTGDDQHQSFPYDATISYHCLPGFAASSHSSTCSFTRSGDGGSGGEFSWKPPPRCTWTGPCSLALLKRNSSQLLVEWLRGSRSAAVVSCPATHTLSGASQYTCSNGGWIAGRLAAGGPGGAADGSAQPSSHDAPFRYPTCQPEAGSGRCSTRSHSLNQRLANLQMKIVVDTGLGVGKLRVACAHGYRLSSGRATALASCTHWPGLEVPRGLVCRATSSQCSNPFARHSARTLVVSSSKLPLIEAGESVHFTCSNNRLLNLTATCVDGALDTPPQTLRCNNPCTRPTVHYVVDGNGTSKRDLCYDQTCAESHAENASVAYTCAGGWMPSSSGGKATCVFVPSVRKHVWRPRPECHYIRDESSCRHDELPSIAGGRCLASRPPAGVYRLGTVLECACHPGHRADQRGRLACSQATATSGGKAEWTWLGNAGEPLQCAHITPSSDPCPRVEATPCGEVYENLIHVNTSQYRLSTDLCCQHLASSCKEVACTYRLWLPYAESRMDLTASVVGNQQDGVDPRLAARVQLQNLFGKHGSTQPSRQAASTSQLTLFGNTTSHRGSADNACARLTVTRASSSRPVRPVEVMLRLLHHGS